MRILTENIKNNPDLLHCTSNTAPLYTRYPLFLTLHDIIFLEKKKRANQSLYHRLGRIYRRWGVPRIIPKCKQIITVSDYERDNNLQTLTLDPHTVTKIYNGLSAAFHPSSKNPDIVKKYIPEEPYLFFLGNTDPKKNIPNTLKAYAIFLQKSKRKLPLLIADLKESVIDAISAKEGLTEIKPNLYFPGYIPNGDLPSVYTVAFSFLYPSLRESFGLPLLESMASGIPVISSKIPAIPEIAGDRAILINPFEPSDIAKYLIELEEDTLWYHEQIVYGLLNASKYSWYNTASKILEKYLSF